MWKVGETEIFVILASCERDGGGEGSEFGSVMNPGLVELYCDLLQ